MNTFSVWAPRATTVNVQLGRSEIPLRPEARGWWKVDSTEAVHGSDYAFLLNGGTKQYPDPRSLWQPQGVHGASRVYDHDLFKWNDAAWQPPPFSQAIIYELHVGTFTSEGTLDAAIRKLEYLLELGITHIELMPVASFPGSRGWGYDGVFLFATQEPYGGPDALKRFVDAAHCSGLAVLLDVVYNHFGPTGNYAEQFAPYLTDSHSTPWGGAVNLEEAGSDEVRRFFCDNAISWLRDFHMDGLRLDAVHSFVDRSALPFLEQLSIEVCDLSKSLGRKLVLIAESDLNDPRVVTERSKNGLGLDAQWSDDFHHALFSVLIQEKSGYYEDFGKLADLCKALSATFVYDGIYSSYRDRIHGRPASGVSQSRFLGYIQNHDQVGNRALGDRLYPLISQGRSYIAAAIVMTAPFIPMLFQGEEHGSSRPFQYFTDHQDVLMSEAVSTGRKNEFKAFGWQPESIPDPEALETFTNSKLKWDEVSLPPHNDFLAWYRSLIALRKSEPSLHNPDLYATKCTYNETHCWLTIERGPVAVTCNLGIDLHQFEVKSAALLLSSSGDVRYTNDALFLPPDAMAILKSNSAD